VIKAASILMVFLLSACSTTQVRLASELQPSSNTAIYELKYSVKIQAANANASTLKQGTTWAEVGAIEQGTVYRTKDQVVIVNSFDVHEGYIVIKDAQVVGYYLPVEKTFVETEPKAISLNKKEN